MSLYLSILLISVFFPLILSFDKKLKFYKKWNALLPAIFIASIPYLIFDIYMTYNGVWGFNPKYHANIIFLGLPLEEWLFFWMIPYCSIFLHETIAYYLPRWKFNQQITNFISLSILFLSGLLIFLYYDKAYTIYISITTAVVLVIAILSRYEELGRFYLTFIFILVPFLLVNGILTGMFTDEEIVWYNNNENMGMRLNTIPLEDIGYAFSLLLLNLVLNRSISKNKNQSNI